jgi:hypothetical protein
MNNSGDCMRSIELIELLDDALLEQELVSHKYMNIEIPGTLEHRQLPRTPETRSNALSSVVIHDSNAMSSAVIYDNRCLRHTRRACLGPRQMLFQQIAIYKKLCSSILFEETLLRIRI